MNWVERKKAATLWGKMLGQIAAEETWPGFDSGMSEEEFLEFKYAVKTAHHHNGWFAEGQVVSALQAIAQMLEEEKLNTWLARYEAGLSKEKAPRTIGTIMAGNLPMVGFHDLLCVLLAGHRFVGKLSSQDKILLPKAVNLLVKVFPDLKNTFVFEDGKLEGYDAIVATGSNNTARYFEYYFSHCPHIIRKNRQSIAIINGTESEEELKALGKDVFSYFGLGCRNVSKVMVPSGFDVTTLLDRWESYYPVLENNKYKNNYDYHKSIYLLNQDKFLDNGFLLLMEKEPIASPMATLHYGFYENKDDLHSMLSAAVEEIQCLVGQGGIAFGTSQQPELWDYADGVDTMQFLLQDVYYSNS